MKTRLLPLALALLAGVIPALDNDAMIYVVHGIPGTALGAATTDLPVDIAVNGACVPALNALNFAQIRGPLPLPPNTYNIEIKPADTLVPCSKPTLLSKSVNVTAGLNASIVAHLTALGAPTISTFVNDVASTPGGRGRFLLHHAAQAPAVTVNVTRGNGNGNAPSAAIPNFSNGLQVPAELLPGNWRASLELNGATVFGPATLRLQPNTVELVYAIGTFPNSFRIITRTIPTMR